MAGDSTVQLERQVLVSCMDSNCSNGSTDALQDNTVNFGYISDSAHHCISSLQCQDIGFVIRKP